MENSICEIYILIIHIQYIIRSYWEENTLFPFAYFVGSPLLPSECAFTTPRLLLDVSRTSCFSQIPTKKIFVALGQVNKPCNNCWPKAQTPCCKFSTFYRISPIVWRIRFFKIWLLDVSGSPFFHKFPQGKDW